MTFNPTMRDILYVDRMCAAYKGSAEWSSTYTPDPIDDVEQDPVEFDSVPNNGWTEKAAALALRDCADFYWRAGKDLEDMEPGQAGHDFWLTRNGHGAGFWDRGLGDLGDRLTAIAELFDTLDLYLTESEEVSFEHYPPLPAEPTPIQDK